MGAAVRERRAQLVNDAAADPRYIPTPGAVGIRAELAAPIVLGEELLGVLNVESQSPFSEEDQTALGVVADHLAVALGNARLFGQVQELAALEARQRLARDLHDSVVQLLFSATLVAQSVGRAFRRDASEGERQVQRMLDLTRAALVEMRCLVTELRPTEPVPELDSAESALRGLQRLRRDGLASALRDYAEEIRPDGLLIELEADGYAPQPLDREEVLYRIGQEALNNVTKHARALHVRLVLRSGEDGVRLDVADDGAGLDPGAVARSWSGVAGGLGLASMRERAEALHGRLRLGPVRREAPWSRSTCRASARHDGPPHPRPHRGRPPDRPRGLADAAPGGRGHRGGGRGGGRAYRLGLVLTLHPEVVLLDLVMPGLSGAEAIRKMKDSAKGVEVLVLTSFAEEGQVQQAVAAGAVGYVLKDVLKDDLLRAIRNAREGKPWLHPEAQRQLMKSAGAVPAATALDAPQPPRAHGAGAGGPRPLEPRDRLSPRHLRGNGQGLRERCARQARPCRPHPGGTLRGASRSGFARPSVRGMTEAQP